MKVTFSIVVVLMLMIVVGIVSPQTQSEPVAKRRPPFEILFPKDKTYLTQRTIEIIGIADDDTIQQFSIRIAGSELVGDEAIPIVKGAFKATVDLQVGLNEIFVSSENGEAKLSIFLAADENATDIPGDFREYYLHIPTDQKTVCTDCHKLDTTPINYQRMNVMGSTCQTDACHEGMGKDKYVHGPVGGGVCISCHNPHGSVEKHSVSRSGLPLCLVCHEDKEYELKQQHVHGIITSDGCMDCHDPHESPNEFQLVSDTTSGLCYGCHSDARSKMQHVHGPVADGDCNVCHNPHASPNEFMLMESGDDLCFLCHEIVQEEMNRPNSHPPVEDACSNCHDAHGSPNEKMLNKVENVLCFDCHEETQQHVETAVVKHKPVEAGNCTDCHMPHGSDHAKLLQTTAKQLCFSCHEDIGKLVSESQYRHGPVQEDDCYACHVPHGSPNPKILAKFFPAKFYNPYKEENYALCFECHNKNIALDEFTTTLTDFRNGNRNLHYLHVHKSKKGRSCKACHEVHASNQARHIRTEVPYGKMWSYPIKYTETEGGGTCVVGCHKPKDYDRIEPVAYE